MSLAFNPINTLLIFVDINILHSRNCVFDTFKTNLFPVINSRSLWSGPTVVHPLKMSFSDKVIQTSMVSCNTTCCNLLWRASQAAALIRRSWHYDAVLHATVDILEFTGSGGAVAGDEGLVVALGGHHIEGCVLCLLPFYQDRVTVALCHYTNRC